MRAPQARRFSRRRFLGGLTLMGTAGLLGWHPRRAAAEPPLETTRLRLEQIEGICIAPQYVAEELLHVEGFTEGQYVKTGYGATLYQALGSGALDLAMAFVPASIIQLDAGTPIVLLGGVHVGCSRLILIEAPSSAYHRGMLALGKQP